MKLVDILALELKAWPEQYDCLSQTRHDGWIINGRGFDGVILARLELAEDSLPAGVIVTKAQWQAAVDALKAAENALPHWTGEGLPPVGTVCEFEVETDDWRQCEVIAIKDDYAICWIHVNKIFATGGASVRPLRTPEQIAAEERNIAINAMVERCPYPGSDCTQIDCAALYDAGYRKLETVDN